MFKVSAENQIVKVFNFVPTTKELIGPCDAWVVPHTGLPANCTTDKPPVLKINQAAVYINTGWQIVEDYRGATVYDISNRGASRVDALGPIPDDKTRIAPASEFDEWNGKKWVKDKSVEKTTLINQAAQDKKDRIAVASEHISILTFAKDSEQATEDELLLLTAWQNHRLQLSRVDVSSAPDVIWPGEPADVA
ncbi:tail fiber assembly protein [Ewingella americana]|uniref:Tail fiber assembly protein n=1 Tax=Ewingella americana TaxID=41202 RepID=A0A502GI66_9GAMM|nr:tail fiber assembly protein [Ewingella americana]TPG61491.1 tail fiber assembly protein [Ewingella americana]